MRPALNSLARGPLLVVAALIVALAVLWALVSQGYTQFIVPPPEQVGQSFFNSLKSHDFGAAREQLSQDLQQQVSADDLRQMNARLDAAKTGIEQASGQTAQTQGQTATATVEVKLKDGTEQTVEVPLHQENGLWSITSLAPLEALIGLP
jgi:hypothetical protein